MHNTFTYKMHETGYPSFPGLFTSLAASNNVITQRENGCNTFVSDIRPLIRPSTCMFV